MFKFPLAAIAVLAAAPAAAQDATSFTGPRAEATVGWSQLRFDLSDLGTGSGRSHPSDIAFGGAGGYDVAVSPTMIGGIEVAMQGTDIGLATGTTLNGGRLRARREIDVTGRLGTPITANTLLYGKVGYGNLQLRETRTVAGVAANTIRDLDGLVLGAGVEVKMSPKAYLKTEYRYGNYSYDYTSNQVTTGIGLRF